MEYHALIVLFTVLATAFTDVSGGVLSANERILNGDQTTIDEAPYQVALFYIYPPDVLVLRCGGSIISPSTVLTAAHCLYGTYVTDWMMRAGSSNQKFGGQLKELRSAILHPKYENDRFDYDIALAFPEESFQLDGIYIAVIAMARDDQVLEDDTVCLFTGWGAALEGGRTRDILHKTTLPIVNQQTCEDAYERGLVNERMMCAGYFPEGGKGPCNGDFGGPLAKDGILYGVASWAAGCGRRAFPAVFARIHSYRGWIEANMKP